jgi:hypothetical protein
LPPLSSSPRHTNLLLAYAKLSFILDKMSGTHLSLFDSSCLLLYIKQTWNDSPWQRIDLITRQPSPNQIAPTQQRKPDARCQLTGQSSFDDQRLSNDQLQPEDTGDGRDNGIRRQQDVRNVPGNVALLAGSPTQSTAGVTARPLSQTPNPDVSISASAFATSSGDGSVLSAGLALRQSLTTAPDTSLR